MLASQLKWGNMALSITKPEFFMNRCFIILAIFWSGMSWAESEPVVPEPPELPLPVQSEEEMEPDITIIRKGKKTIEEYRINGQLYMIRIKPDIGPPYYLIDTDGDGNMDVRRSDLDKGLYINQWKLLEWD
jgi:hypothetical protein